MRNLLALALLLAAIPACNAVLGIDEPTLVALQTQFQGHALDRRYLALVEGVVKESGTFRTKYGRDPNDRKKFSSEVTTGKRAVTHWKVRERFPGATLVEVRLETGRTHQIRVHFADAGHPLVGDALCVAAGWLRMNGLLALVFMAAGRLARYAAVAFVS